MPDQTPNLTLPFIAASQAQKHVTHNEAIRLLDAIVHLSVASRTVADPPSSPADGVRYIVPGGATGAWSGATGRIAAFHDGAWALLSPREGWLAWVAAEGGLCVYTSGSWEPYASGVSSVNPAEFVGVNATADTDNRLAVASPASLFNHNGAGHQIKINKAAVTDTASQLFQTNFSGRAEFGLTGDDNFHVKVSANGTTWRESIVVERNSGLVAVPRGVESIQVSVGQDAVVTIPTPSVSGLVAVSNVHPQYPQASLAGIISYDTGLSPAVVILAGGSALKVSTTAVTGTTGAVNNVTISATASSQLLLENRMTTTPPVQFCLTFINGWRSLS